MFIYKTLHYVIEFKSQNYDIKINNHEIKGTNMTHKVNYEIKRLNYGKNSVMRGILNYILYFKCCNHGIVTKKVIIMRYKGKTYYL